MEQPIKASVAIICRLSGNKVLARNLVVSRGSQRRAVQCQSVGKFGVARLGIQLALTGPEKQGGIKFRVSDY